MAKYFRSSLMAMLMVLTIYTYMLGGWWIWAVFVGAMAVFAVLDAVLPEGIARSPPMA